MTTTVPARSNQPMHNFSLPLLKWGHRSHANTSTRCRRLLSLTTNSNPLRRPEESDPLCFITKDKPMAVEDVLLIRESKVSDVDAADGEVKPWNLRPRRSPISDSPARMKYGRSLRVEENEDDNMKRKLLISLTKEEIEEDVYALTGSKPARRPKKRNKTIQKQVDNLFPGFYLDGISPDSYRA